MKSKKMLHSKKAGPPFDFAQGRLCGDDKQEIQKQREPTLFDEAEKDGAPRIVGVT
jgi:hypothetical protein